MSVSWHKLCQSLLTVFGLLGYFACNDTARAEPDIVKDKKSHDADTNFATIVFPKRKYSFTLAEAARGIAIPYEVVVEQDTPGIVPIPQTAHAGITVGKTKGDKEAFTGLIPFEALTGNGQYYGLSDFGLAPPMEVPPATVRKVRSKRVFKWSGRNWYGPSDTGAPPGKPFPPGKYTLEVSCIGIAVTKSGQQNFKIAGQVRIDLTE